MLGSNPGQGRRSFLLFNRFPVVFDKVGYGAGTGCGNRAKAARTVKEQCCVVGTIVCFPAQVAAIVCFSAQVAQDVASSCTAELATTLHGFDEGKVEPGTAAFWAALCEMMCGSTGVGTSDGLVVGVVDGRSARFVLYISKGSC